MAKDSKKGIVERAVEAATKLVGAEDFVAHAEDHREHVASDEARSAYEAAKLNAVEHYADMPKGVALQMRFANGSEFIDGSVAVGADDFKSETLDRVTYAKPIDFDPLQAPDVITEAWLVASNGDAVCCSLSGGLPVGGGSHAKIPAGHLLF